MVFNSNFNCHYHLIVLIAIQLVNYLTPFHFLSKQLTPSPTSIPLGLTHFKLHRLLITIRFYTFNTSLGLVLTLLHFLGFQI